MTDEKLAEFTAGFEGFSSLPYPDVGGVWTQAFGSTRDIHGNPVTRHTPAVTRAQGLAMLQRDMEQAVSEVRQGVKAPLTADEEEALDDLVYNIGYGHFHASTLYRLLNAGDYAGAAAHIKDFDTVHGKVIAGLLRRRVADQKLFVEGMAPGAAKANPAPVAAAPVRATLDPTDALNQAQIDEITRSRAA